MKNFVAVFTTQKVLENELMVLPKRDYYITH